MLDRFKKMKGMAENLKKLEHLTNNPEKLIKEVMELQDDNPLFQEMKGLKMEDLTPTQKKIEVKFLNESPHEDPKFQHKYDSGFDFRANLGDETITLKPLERTLVPTGLYFELPENYELQVRPRSGLAAKNGITVLNTPGTVDRGYRGEIKIILINLGQEDFTISDGDRVAQGVINGILSEFWSVFTKVDTLNTTERSDKGFGSTGKK
jgi:dUTP pyrophosphatase|tara:strand:- start:4779 stop:5402 length:624 start_codon:yes stop_codon:yes gene_type:complete